jgi:hypothetical protein
MVFADKTATSNPAVLPLALPLAISLFPFPAFFLCVFNYKRESNTAVRSADWWQRRLYLFLTHSVSMTSSLVSCPLPLPSRSALFLSLCVSLRCSQSTHRRHTALALTVLSFTAQLYVFGLLGRPFDFLPDDIDEPNHVALEALDALSAFCRGWSLIGAGVALGGFVGIALVRYVCLS